MTGSCCTDRGECETVITNEEQIVPSTGTTGTGTTGKYDIREKYLLWCPVQPPLVSQFK